MSANPLSGKRYHIIGRMKSKPSIMARMEIAGAIYRAKLSSLTDILVIPDDVEAQNQSLTQTLTIALEMEKKGKLKILSENQIEEVLSYEEKNH